MCNRWKIVARPGLEPRAFRWPCKHYQWACEPPGHLTNNFHLNPTRLHMYQYTHHNLPMKFQLFIWSISLLVGDMMILWIKPLVVVWTIFLFFYLFSNIFSLVDVIMHERDVDKSSSHMWPVEHLGILSDIILNVPLVDFNMLLLLVYCNVLFQILCQMLNGRDLLQCTTISLSNDNCYRFIAMYHHSSFKC